MDCGNGPVHLGGVLMSQALKEWAFEVNPPSEAEDLLRVDPEYDKWADDYDRRTAELRQGEDMNINDVYASDSDYLKAADLKGKGVKLTISQVDVKSFDEKSQDGRAYEAQKLILSFEGTPKQLVTNKTNSRSIGAMFGPETTDWIGKQIKLFTAQVDFQGTQVPAIRVQVDMPEESFDDDLSF